MLKTVADVLVGALEQVGVKHIFGLIGDSLNPLADAVRAQNQAANSEQSGVSAGLDQTASVDTNPKPAKSQQAPAQQPPINARSAALAPRAAEAGAIANGLFAGAGERR